MRILVIEDEHRIANMLKKGLEQERFAVDAVYNGTEGFDLASTEDYDLIILDLMLPEMNGIEICKKLRAPVPSTKICPMWEISKMPAFFRTARCSSTMLV